MARLILEVLDAAGSVRWRTRIESLPLTVGRGYRNDVILDDPYVSETHVRLSSAGNGGIVADDVDTVNGMSRYVVQSDLRRVLRVSARGEQVRRVVVEPGLCLRVGRTILRFRDIDAAVAPALVEKPHAESDLLARLLAPAATTPLAIGAVSACSVSIYLSTFQRAGSAARGVGMSVMILVIMSVWAAAWALATRINRNHTHFREHFAIACIAAIGLVVAISAGSVAGAIVPLFDTTAFLGFSAILCFTFVTVAHLSFASLMTRRKRWIVASSVVVATLALVGSAASSRGGGYSTRMQYPTTLLPLAPRLLSTVSPEQFFDRSGDLLTALDEGETK